MEPCLSPGESSIARYISISPKTSFEAREKFPVSGVSSFCFSCSGNEDEILRKDDKFYSLDCDVFSHL